MQTESLLPPQYRAPALTPAAELSLMFLAGLLSPFLIDAPMEGISHTRGESAPLLGCSLLALNVARFGLFAIWLAWGAARVVWRLAIILPGIVAPALVWSGATGEAEWRQMLSVLLVAFLGTAATSAFPRLFGAYRINIYDSPEDHTTQRNRAGQFGLVDIFAWTATVAVLAGIIRWVGFPRDTRALVILLITLLVMGIYVLLASWAVLTRKEPIYNRIAIALAVPFVGATALCALTNSDAEVAFYVHFTLLMNMALLIGGLYVARSFGVRVTTGNWPMVTSPFVARRNETGPEIRIPGPE